MKVSEVEWIETLKIDGLVLYNKIMMKLQYVVSRFNKIKRES